MKIALVSYYSRNYGALLQGFALQEVLQSMGHEVIAVNRGWKDYGNLVWDFNYSIFDRLKHFLIPSPFDDFVRKHIRISKVIHSNQDLVSLSQNVDVVIAGSDQIWNVETEAYMGHYFFLDWVAAGTGKYSYAASFGKDTYNANEKEICRLQTLLRTFNGVSVRETSGIDICRSLFSIEAEVHLDPTLLLPADRYRSMIAIKQIDSNYLCSYILDYSMEINNIIRLLSANLNVHTVYNNTQKARFRQQLFDKTKRMPTVYQWLANIANAKYVITDSFHGTVFSVIFHKQFICINNRERGSARFESLLDMLKLQDRLIDIHTANLDYIMKLITKKIEYETIDNLIEKHRNSSLEYLKKIHQ